MVSEAHQRRIFLKSALAVISSLIVPSVAYSRWDKNAYNKTEIVASVQSVGVTNLADLREGGGKITLLTPKIAENGAIVPITVTSKIPNTERIFIFAEKNPQPLVSDYVLTPNVDPFVASRIKMSETAFVHAIVLGEGVFYRTAREVKVTIGGCGEDS